MKPIIPQIRPAALRLALLALTLVLLAGCSGTPKTQFYTLNTPHAEQANGPNDTVLAIGPIDLPEYLQRPQIVTRPESNRLAVDEFNRWGGSLEEEIDRVVAQNLGVMVGTQRVYSYPSRIVADIDYRISLYLRAFDGALEDQVTLDISWSIIDERSARVLQTNQNRYQAQVNSSDYAAYASALSDTLTQLSRDLAADLATVQKPGK